MCVKLFNIYLIHNRILKNINKTNIGEVIKAWDIGIATIRRGEKASLICAPEYGK